MCGITGAFNYNKGVPVSFETIKRMNDEIFHRGPDDEGFYVKNNIGIAMRRLSIIDLDTGSQPMHNEDRSVRVVFNGEIYNYVELTEELKKLGHSFYTKSDTEVIVHLYEEYGMDFPLHLNGMYAIALWDERKETLILVRDRVGIKPLYYAETNEGLMFGSEIKALLMGGVSRRADYEAINQYLSYGYIPSPLTGFKAIRKLDAGHMLICSHKGCSKKEFWDLNLGQSLEDVSEREIVDLLIDELQTVLQRQTRSDVPLGIFLSGGIDSALMASVAAEKCNLKLNAYTIGYEEKSYNELDNAHIIASRLGIPLNKMVLTEKEIFNEIEQIISGFDEPLMDYSAIPTYFVSKFARSGVKTVLSGEGGDELFAGYQTHYLYKLTRLYRTIPRALRDRLSTAVNNLPESHAYLSWPFKLKRFTYGAEFPYDEAHYRWKVLFDADEKKKLLSSDYLQSITDMEPYHKMEEYFIRAEKRGDTIQEQLLYVDFKTFLQDDLLHKNDRMSMANGLEARVPLLDNAIIDLSRRIPKYKIKGFRTKNLLRKALFRFQPFKIAFGRKRGFTPPVAIWIKKGLKDYMLSSLSEEALSKTSFLNYHYVAKIIDDHLNGKAENSRLIWSLIVLVNWHRTYVDE